MIDHVSLFANDLIAARTFYQQALAPLGYELIAQIPNAEDPFVIGFGEKGKPDLWIAKGPSGHVQHVALRAATRKVVQAFHAAALAAGGKDNGAPGVRPHYHPNYYGGFIIDADGHNVEAVCHDAYLE